jgi:AbiTii
MSLLQDIQRAATESTTPLPDLLRLMHTLSYRLDNTELRDWVTHELNGYPASAELPDYRVKPCHVRGDFVSIAWKASAVSIPRSAVLLDADDGDWLFRVELRESVAAYQTHASSSVEELQSPWPPELAMLLSGQVLEGMQCLSAYRVLPRAMFTSLLDSVRTRALTFALELERQLPDLGDLSTMPSAPIAPEKLAPAIHQYIFGNQANVTGRAETVKVSSVQITVGSVDSLVTALGDLGLPAAELEELREALAADASAGNSQAPGEHTTGWIGRIAARIGTGSLRLAGTVTTDVIVGLVMQHFGLHPG